MVRRRRQRGRLGRARLAAAAGGRYLSVLQGTWESSRMTSWARYASLKGGRCSSPAADRASGRRSCAGSASRAAGSRSSTSTAAAARSWSPSSSGEGTAGAAVPAVRPARHRGAAGGGRRRRRRRTGRSPCSSTTPRATTATRRHGDARVLGRPLRGQPPPPVLRRPGGLPDDEGGGGGSIVKWARSPGWSARAAWRPIRRRSRRCSA